MGDWFSQISTPQPAQKKTADGKTDWAADLTKPRTFDDAAAARDAGTTTTVQTDRLARAQALRDRGLVDPRMGGNPDVPIEGFMRTNTPEIQPATRSNFGATFMADLASDVGTKRRLAAGSLFPGDPNGAKRVGVLDGKLVYVNDSGQLEEVSGFGTRASSALLSNAPEIAGSVAGSFATGNPVTGAALGGAAGKGIKRGAMALFAGEPVSAGSVSGEMALEAGVNAVSGLAGKGILAVTGRDKIVDFSSSKIKSAEQARDYIKRTTGIDVDLAQASGDRKLIALRAYAARYPGRSAELIQASDEAANGQLDAAVTRVMNQIARGQPSEVAGAAGVNAAQMSIAAVKGIRDKAVAPYYEAAGKVVLGSDVVSTISADPLIARAARRVAGDPVYQRKLAGMPENSIGYWQQVKRSLDSGYETATAAGNKTVAREYADAAKQLTQKLEAASPEYQQANAFFAEQTKKIVEPLENSAVGVLAKIKNPKTATAAARIFSDPNITANEIRATRASLSQQNPDAWNGLVRQWVGQQWNKALKTTQTGDSVNPAGKLRQALVGTPDMRAKMDAAVGPGAAQAFDDLMIALQSLARTPTAGSNTYRDQTIGNELRGTAAVLFKWATSPRKSVTDAAEQRALDQNVTAITEALLDPAKRNQLKMVVKMQPSTRKAVLLTTILGGQAAAIAGAPDEDQAPPLLQR